MISNYTRFIKVDEGVVAYNTLYDSSILIQDSNIADVKDYLEDSKEKYLLDMGLIVKDHEYEKKLVREMYTSINTSKKNLYIMLIMTYGCNSSCSYCFESNAKKLDRHNHKMTNSEIVNYIIEKYNEGFTSLDLHYFGGEPLMKYNDILEINNMILSSGININSNVITNGTLLTKNIAEKLIYAGIKNYQITIDGTKELHDIRRPLKNMKSSYDLILKNIESIIYLPLNISIRVNIDSENIEYIDKVVEALPREFFNKNNNIYLAPVVGVLNINQKNTLNNRYIVLERAYQIVKEKRLPIIIPKPGYSPCPHMSEESAFYLDFGGNKYTCGGFVGDEDKIDSKNDVKTKFGNSRLNSMFIRESCMSCSVLPICTGGCAFETVELGNYCQKYFLEKSYDLYMINNYQQKLEGNDEKIHP